MKILSLFVRKKREKYYVLVEYRDEKDNKRKQKSLGRYDTERQATKALAIEKAKYYNNDLLVPQKLTLETFLRDWHSKRYNTLSITTYNRYGLILEEIIGYMGNVEMQKVTPLLITNFLDSRMNKNIENQPLSEKTKLQYFRFMNKAFGDAAKLQIINKNPMIYVNAPKPKKVLATYLDLQQSKDILHEVKNTSYNVPVNLAISLGLRASEVCGLRWSRIDFKNNLITIDAAAVYDEKLKVKILKDLKNDSSYRVLTAPGGLMDLLKDHKSKQYDLFGLSEEDDFFVYTCQNGEMQTSRSFCSSFARLVRYRPNLKNISFHKLRHTNASILLALKCDMKVISNRLGHSQIGITMDTYTHVLNSLEQDAATKINNALYN